MKIIVRQVELGNVYSVNGKEIVRDSEDRFTARTELSIKEQRAFQIYKATVIDNPSFKGNHPKGVYNL